jgi:hypothetical protein
MTDAKSSLPQKNSMRPFDIPGHSDVQNDRQLVAGEEENKTQFWYRDPSLAPNEEGGGRMCITNTDAMLI